MSESEMENNRNADDNVDIEENSMEEEDMTGCRLQQLLYTEENLHNAEGRGLTDDENWTIVGSKEKRRKTEKIEVSISSKEKLPKQFALAKLFNVENISGIHRVKYVNAFKVLVSFDDEASADKLIKCQCFEKKEWRIKKTWEVDSSYGIIRDIDIELSESDLLECIKSNNKTEIVSVKRLSRRSTESEWLQSETVRICFKGSFLPPYIKIFNMRVAVEPYVFPVTQCSRCWRFGHTVKLCPSLKVICPKCGKDHPNCETTTFKCVNCKGNHMSLAKSCPVYLKEKKIRALMSEFNCSYRRALTMYVPPFSPRPTDQYRITNNTNMYTNEQNYSSSPKTYASILKNIPTNIIHNSSSEDRTGLATKRKQRSSSEQLAYEENESLSSELHTADSERYTPAAARVHTEDRRRRTGSEYTINIDTANAVDDTCSNNNKIPDERAVHSNMQPDSSKSLESFIGKIKLIILSKRYNFTQKIKNIINVSVDWCISAIIDNFKDISIFRKIFDFAFNSQNG